MTACAAPATPKSTRVRGIDENVRFDVVVLGAGLPAVVKESLGPHTLSRRSTSEFFGVIRPVPR
jgi:hypothetical protein